MATDQTSDGRPSITEGLARRLVDTQFPQWAGWPLSRLGQAGFDHAIYRLGDELSVRLPLHAGAIGQAEKEFHWLPRLAPHLPLAIPTPVGVGEPDLGYPWPWAVSRWLDGEGATVDALADSAEAAVTIAAFLTALQRCTPPDADRAARPDLTGRPLAARDQKTRADIAATASVFDAGAMTEVWEAALDAPAWGGEPVWFHGDFHTGNLLTAGGRLSAVLDFGGLGVGDPACDLTIAFTLMSPGSRTVFRAALGVDDATWARGRGWALTTGLNAYRPYAALDARVAAQTTRQITQGLAG